MRRLIRFPATDRVERLRPFANSSNIHWVGEINYERIITRTYRETQGDPMILRRAKAFAAICRELVVGIEDENLLAGYFFGKNRGTRPHAVSFNGGALVLPKAGLTDAELEEFERDLKPYWAGEDGTYRRTRYGQAYQRYTEAQKNYFFMDPDAYPQVPPFVGNADYCRIPHVCHHELQARKILEIGLKGFIKEAEERLARVDVTDPLRHKKIHFLKGVIIGLDGHAR